MRRFLWSALGLSVVVLAFVAQPARPTAQVSRGVSFSCNVVNSTATALTAFAGQCIAPQNGQAFYITDISASSSAIATTTTDQYLTVKSGTGGSCGTSTDVMWASYNLALTNVTVSFNTPIRVQASEELCWMDAAAGNKSFVVSGYLGP